MNQTNSMERFNPLNDFLFLKVMGEPGDEEQCLAFLNAVLADSRQNPITLVKIIDNKLINPEIKGNKGSVLDVLALDEYHNKYEIEVQLKNLHNMEKRTLYYWAWEYAESIATGMDYDTLPRVITINIVNFDNIKVDRYHTTFHIGEDTNKEYILTDMLEIHFLNMVKFRRVGKEERKETALGRWLTYFDVSTPDEEVEEVIRMESGIRKAEERLRFVTQDKEFLRAYRLSIMAECDRVTELNTAEERGIEKGSINIAKNALSEGLSIDIIKKITGLDESVIISLQDGK